MNCKFCGNFVPDGSDSCNVCGRRPSEEPIGKLLSENQPQALAAPAAAESGKDAVSTKKHKKSLGGPLVSLILGVVGWISAFATDIFTRFTTYLNSIFGKSALDSETYQGGGNDKMKSIAAEAIIIGFIALASILLVVGLISLFKRLYNKVKYADE